MYIFLSIEGIPVIIRFKTLLCQVPIKLALHRIEGSPLLTRFKTRKGLQPILLELLY